MKYVIGAIVGIVWGALAALLNNFISAKAIASNSTKLMLLSNFFRLVVDVAALGIVFLLHNVSPLSFEATIVGTAAGLSITMIVLAYRMMGK